MTGGWGDELGGVDAPEDGLADADGDAVGVVEQVGLVGQTAPGAAGGAGTLEHQRDPGAVFVLGEAGLKDVVVLVVVRSRRAGHQVHRHFPPACLCPSSEDCGARAAAGYATAQLKRMRCRLEQIDGFLAQAGPSLDAEPL